MASVKVVTADLYPDLPNAAIYPVLHPLLKLIHSKSSEDRPTFEEIYRALSKEDGEEIPEEQKEIFAQTVPSVDYNN